MVSVDGIVSYFKKQVGPASVALAGEEQLQKFISEKDSSVVGEYLSSHSFQFLDSKKNTTKLVFKNFP